jgi:hypothetical protein
VKLYCTNCGRERSRANASADSGACLCGNSAWCSRRPAPFQWPPSWTFRTSGWQPDAPS